jgi:hypothetical protein
MASLLLVTGLFGKYDMILKGKSQIVTIMIGLKIKQ